MSPATKAACLIAGLVLVVGCAPVRADLPNVYTPYRGPWEPVAVSEPTAAPSAAPAPFYRPVARPAPTPKPVPPRPVAGHAKTPAPRLSGRVVAGVASWYAYVAGGAAAGPALRAALGSAWRGSRVEVCAGSRCVRAVLSDWCACPGGRVVDLDARLFAALAPLSRGLVEVAVWR